MTHHVLTRQDLAFVPHGGWHHAVELADLRAALQHLDRILICDNMQHGMLEGGCPSRHHQGDVILDSQVPGASRCLPWLQTNLLCGSSVQLVWAHRPKLRTAHRRRQRLERARGPASGGAAAHRHRHEDAEAAEGAGLVARHAGLERRDGALAALGVPARAGGG